MRRLWRNRAPFSQKNNAAGAHATGNPPRSTHGVVAISLANAAVLLTACNTIDC